ncbi:MAG: SpoIIE family protein phosphatase [Planctomycetes bacterium]|nr:SpoIIE family protein phosphatase [Planctomycetota bacterium]
MDRKRGEYTFIPGADTVKVAGKGEKAALEELELLFHPYAPRRIQDFWEMFHPEVAGFLRGLLAGSPEEAAAFTSPAEPVQPPEPPSRIAAVAVGTPEVLAAPPAPLIRVPSRTPPLAAVQDLKKQVQGVFADWLAEDRGAEAVIGGEYDDQIQEMVVGLCRDIQPKHLLASVAMGEGCTTADQVTRSAMTSQAIGSQMALNEVELFLLAKSAISQALSRTGYRSIMSIKSSLLVNEYSPSLGKKLCQYYRDMENFLAGQRVDGKVADLITKSKFIYLNGDMSGLEDQTLALGIADAFMALKNASRKSIEILHILPQRLRQILSMGMEPLIASAEKLLQETCYNQYRQSLHAHLSGGDHCDFFQISPSQRGLLIFDVSGHEERASRYRDLLVRFLDQLPGREDPAYMVTETNRFALRFPFPEDLFVSMFYGVIEAQRDRFIYANAGHHAPYLVRQDRVMQLPEKGGLTLNVEDVAYQNEEIPLCSKDCLVFYTDGLTESVLRKGEKELFGKKRLEDSLLRQQIYKRKTKDSVRLILSAVRDEGFEVEDDVTVQVYRHV